jgi:H/ACA ribonucleoprotein complex subunit 4
MLPFEKVKREVLVRKEAETSEKFGTNPEKRAVQELVNYGVINIDKPAGPTSHQVSAYVQQILGISKAGHSGTLDPGTTGVFPVALGRATRIVQLLLTAGKEYVALMHLHKEVPQIRIQKAANEFVGSIKQLPPVKSAVKRQLRERNIYYLDILEVDGRDVLFRAGCEAGTYIRTLCVDFGKRLGVGAHMVELRRTKAGPFDESTIVTLQDVADAFWYWKNESNEKYIRKVIQPTEAAIEHLPKIWVMDTTTDSLCHGANLHVPGISKVESGINPEDAVAVVTLKNELICYGAAKMKSKEMLGKKGLAVKTEKVFMPPGAYPRIERAA